ncbi:MAG: GIY-YIG nuclease family protein [Pseudomonadota bacterium]
MTGRRRGEKLILHFVDGTPEGLIQAELMNWSGSILRVPRAQLAEALSLQEAGAPGVYVLMGDIDGEATAYIGETDEIRTRIKTHDQQRTWWSSAVFITASTQLNKASVQYLESRLIEVAKRVKRVKLANGQAPTLPTLSKSDEDALETFLENLWLVLPALRVDFFLEMTRPAVQASHDPQFVLLNSQGETAATAFIHDGEFIVRQGSSTIAKSGELLPNSYFESLQARLLKSGVVKLDGGRGVFTANTAFQSANSAAAIISGTSELGTVQWKLKGSDRTYQDWEAEQLAAKEEGPE